MSAANMDEAKPKQRIRLILNGKEQLFPEKLYDVANDCYLVKWNRNGSISAVDEELFEKSVMQCYPGFLQIPTFINFRRLFREYDFNWCYNQDGTLEFSHPSFVRGRRQLLSEIQTRRKSYSIKTPRKVSPEIEHVETDPNRRYPSRKRRKTAHFSPNDSSRVADANNVDLGGGGDYFNKHSHTGNEENTPTFQKLPRCELDFRQPVPDFMEDFANNEFNEEEYNEWINKQRRLDESNTEIESQDTIREEYSWMYYTDLGEQPTCANNETGELVLETLEPTNKDLSAPCGLCKCCMSMNNILNIETHFGNIQNAILTGYTSIDSLDSQTIQIL